MIQKLKGLFHRTSIEPVRPEEDLSLAIRLIKSHEGFRSWAYLDPAGVWTIGYGTTRYPNGIEVQEGDRVKGPQATGYLMDHVWENIVGPLRGLLDVPMNTNQYNAVVSFIYNVGIGAFEDSTMRAHINAGKYFLAAQEFGRWTYAGGKQLDGLKVRRIAERKLFEKHSSMIMDI